MEAAAPAFVLQVRGVEPGDADAVSALLETLGYPCSPDEARARIAEFRETPRQFMLIAERDGTPAGFAAMMLNYSITRGANVARLTAMVVHADAHGQGIGRKLLREMETLARRNGAVRLEVTSNPTRKGAHAFYHACGYTDGSRHFVKLLGD